AGPSCLLSFAQSLNGTARGHVNSLSREEFRAGPTLYLCALARLKGGDAILQHKVEALSGLRRAAAVVCAVALVVTPLTARTTRGDKFLKEGEKAEARKDFDAALTY